VPGGYRRPGGPAGGGADTVPQQGRTATSYLVMSGSREINANSLDSVLGSPSAQRPAPSAQRKAVGVDQEAHAQSVVPESRAISYGQTSKSSAMRIRFAKSPQATVRGPWLVPCDLQRRGRPMRVTTVSSPRLTRSTTS
jgi:hypothetical protein